MAIQFADFIGIDVSQHNGTIQWGDVASDPQNIKFAYIKATEGTTIQDPRFPFNRKGANSVGIRNGAYHFYSLVTPPEQQAENFLRVVQQLGASDLPPVLDIEKIPAPNQITPQKLVADLHTWLDIVEAGLGQKPMIYSYKNYWDTVLKSPNSFLQYPIWVANYGRVDSPTSNNPAPAPFLGWDSFAIWQYTSKGNVKGIVDWRGKPVDVDLNKYNLASGLLDFQTAVTISPTGVSEEGIVNTGKLNIRSGAGKNFDLVAMPLPQNQEVTILAEENGWYKVRTEIEGWVSKTYIDLKP
jgi:GH25 family lysozyme M1 (1,4-beta-N-acetylmuramidase)